MKNKFLYILFINLSFFFHLPLRAQLSIDLEGNYIVSSPYNSVRIPASGGTSFDLEKDFSRSTKFTFRIRPGITIKKRHVISLLYAPLSIDYSGEITSSVNYNGKVFSPGKLNANYKFNSYRITYRYKLVNNDKWTLALGLSGKIRDASILLKNDSTSSGYPNVGFVPLVSFYASWRPVQLLKLVIEGDALASKQGRAEDIFAGIYFHLTQKVALKAGYRILEGGANNEKVYNFTCINYASLGTVIEF